MNRLNKPKTMHYDRDMSLSSFMDQYVAQRMQGIIDSQLNLTPSDEQLVEAAEIIQAHINSIWSWGTK